MTTSDCSLEADIAVVLKQASYLLQACASVRRPDSQGDWDYGVAMVRACYLQLKRIFEEEGLLEKLDNPDQWSFVNRMKS